MGALVDTLTGFADSEKDRHAYIIIAQEIEQLYLYLSNLKERVETLEQENKHLKSRIQELELHHAVYGGAKL